MGDRRCSVDGCDRPVYGWGWCSAHYQRWWKHGDPTVSHRKVKRWCVVEGCDRQARYGNLCKMHHGRLQRHGDPTVKVITVTGDVLERVWAKVNVDGPVPAYAPDLGPCSLWTGALSPTGYGKIRWDGGARQVHRVVYEAMVGPIPPGLEIDHLCRVRHCVRVSHLEPVTTAENQRRRWIADGRQ